MRVGSARPENGSLTTGVCLRKFGNNPSEERTKPVTEKAQIDEMVSILRDVLGGY